MIGTITFPEKGKRPAITLTANDDMTVTAEPDAGKVLAAVLQSQLQIARRTHSPADGYPGGMVLEAFAKKHGGEVEFPERKPLPEGAVY